MNPPKLDRHDRKVGLQVAKLVRKGFTNKDLAEWFHCDQSTVDNWMRDSEWAHAVRQIRVERRALMFKVIWDRAAGGNLPAWDRVIAWLNEDVYGEQTDLNRAHEQLTRFKELFASETTIQSATTNSK